MAFACHILMSDVVTHLQGYQEDDPSLWPGGQPKAMVDRGQAMPRLSTGIVCGYSPRCETRLGALDSLAWLTWCFQDASGKRPVHSCQREAGCGEAGTVAPRCCATEEGPRDCSHRILLPSFSQMGTSG
jgi:hypothetical protein